MWFKKLNKTFILGKAVNNIPWEKIRRHLHALIKDEAQIALTSTYAKLQASAKVVPEDYNNDDTKKDVF